MATITRLRHQPLRLISTVLVLFGAATVAGACSSGSATPSSSPDGADEVTLARQALGWKGGCVCMSSACSSTAAGTCIRQPSGSDCPLVNKCLLNYCYVVPDGTTCGGIGREGTTCDGGYCGTCPGCYTANGLCQQKNFEVNTCGLVGSKCLDCDDRNECTTDGCTSRGTCTNAAVSDGTKCASETGRCYGGSCCVGCFINGTCQPNTTPDACGIECKTCQKPTNPCLRAVCNGGECSTTPVDNGTSCSDGNVCNGEEICDGNGTCVPGTEKKCESSDPCVTGSCDPVQGCVTTPNASAKCSDGNACTVGDTCDTSGKCVGGKAKNCNDGNSCTADSCDSATGNCLSSPVTDGQICTDGISCSTAGTCQKGHCTEGNISCEDSNICTSDALDCTNKICTHTPVTAPTACVPTDKCFSSGSCSAGTCVGDTPVNCDDGNPCTKDSCDPATGCVHANEPITTACVDGNPCTTDDRCRLSGKCEGKAIDCAPLDDCHLAGTCDQKTGRCANDPRKDDGSPCANGTGTCQSGSCQISAAGGAAGAAGTAGVAGDNGFAGNAGSAGFESAGNAGSAGSAGAAMENSSGYGGTTTGSPPVATAGAGISESDYFKRNPGGCNCSLPRAGSQRGLGLLALAAFAVGLGRKRRRQ